MGYRSFRSAFVKVNYRKYGATSSAQFSVAPLQQKADQLQEKNELLSYEGPIMQTSKLHQSRQSSSIFRFIVLKVYILANTNHSKRAERANQRYNRA